MAERHPGWVNNIDAFEARLATGLLVAANGVGDALGPLRVRTGIRDAPGFPGQVTVGANKVTVNPFQAVVADPARPALGPYLVTMDAAKDLAIGGANASLYRMDLVVAEVIEAEPGFQVTVYAGENSASTTPPRPAVTNPLSLVLAEITVPPPTVGAPSRKDTRQFTAALNGIIPVWGEADRPANPHGSMIIFRMDTGVIEIRRDGAWVPYRPPRVTKIDWQVPAGTLANNWVNYGAGFATFAYSISDDGWVRFRGLLKGGTANITVALFTLPPGYRPLFQHIFAVNTYLSGYEGKMGRVDVRANGEVLVINANSGWLSMDGVAFATL